MKTPALILLLFFSNLSHAKCKDLTIKEEVNKANYIVWGKVFSSNYKPNFFQRLFNSNDLANKQHEFEFKVQEVLKGSLPSGNTLKISYLIEEMGEPAKVFQDDEEVVLFLENVNSDIATLRNIYCGYWGKKISSFPNNSSKNEKLKYLEKKFE